MANVVNFPAPLKAPSVDLISDEAFLGAVKGLALVYTATNRVDDCVRLTPAQALRIVELAERACSKE